MNNLNNLNKLSNSHLVPHLFIRRQLGEFLTVPTKAKALLASHNIPVSVLSSEGYIESEKLASLAKTVWRLLDDESTGGSEKTLALGSFKMLCHACSDCKSLRAVIHRCGNFFKVISKEYDFNLEVKGEEAIFTLSHNTRSVENSDYFLLCLSIVLVRWFSWLIDESIKLERVEYKFAAFSQPDDFESIFQSNVEFNQSDNRIVFASYLLNKTVDNVQERLPALLVSAPHCFLSHYQAQNSIAEQVRKKLMKIENLDQLHLSELATELHCSTATLTRKLKAENTSFMEIKDRSRKIKAQSLLRTSAMSIANIASLVGFSEASAFTRAFKKWTGESPLEYRNSFINH